MNKMICLAAILGVAGLLGCGEAKKEGNAEVKKAAVTEADKVKATVEDRTAKPKEAGETLRDGKEARQEGRPDGR